MPPKEKSRQSNNIDRVVGAEEEIGSCVSWVSGIIVGVVGCGMAVGSLVGNAVTPMGDGLPEGARLGALVGTSTGGKVGGSSIDLTNRRKLPVIAELVLDEGSWAMYKKYRCSNVEVKLIWCSSCRVRVPSELRKRHLP